MLCCHEPLCLAAAASQASNCTHLVVASFGLSGAGSATNYCCNTSTLSACTIARQLRGAFLATHCQQRLLCILPVMCAASSAALIYNSTQLCAIPFWTQAVCKSST